MSWAVSSDEKDHLELHIVSGRRGRIVAVLHLPHDSLDGRAQGKCPAVVFCHGFTGNHIESNRIGVRLGRAAAESGMALLRFDFVGSGDSDGDFATETTLSGWMQDLTDVLQFVGSHSRIDAERVATLGLSFGGATVLGVGAAGGKVRAVGCWSPVVHLVETFRERVLGPSLWARLLAGEYVDNFFGKGYGLAPTFASDLLKHDILASASKISPTPVWIAHGDADAVIPVSHAHDLKNSLGPSGRLEIFKDADHVFSRHGAEVVRATVAWFRSILF